MHREPPLACGVRYRSVDAAHSYVYNIQAGTWKLHCSAALVLQTDDAWLAHACSRLIADRWSLDILPQAEKHAKHLVGAAVQVLAMRRRGLCQRWWRLCSIGAHRCPTA